MTVTRTAMIMAAGLGTRMSPLSNSRPKPLIEVLGKPLLDHWIEKLTVAGIENIVINVHYLADMVEEHLARHWPGHNIRISDERSQLMETGGGLVRALPLIGEDPFFCINVDNILIDGMENCFAQLERQWDGSRMDGLLLLSRMENSFNRRAKGDFFLDTGMRPIRRGDREDAPYVYTGVQLISRQMLQNPPDGPFSTNIFWDMAISRHRLSGAVYDGELWEISTPECIAPTEYRLGSHG